MKTREKILLVILAAAIFVALGGCKKSGSDYGTYNVGLCSPKGDFLESTVDVQPATFTILASSDGPTSVEKRDPPLVLKYVGDSKDGLRRYVVTVGDHQDEVDVTVAGGELKGLWFIAGKQQATLHGHKGTIETEGQDGEAEVKNCQGQ